MKKKIKIAFALLLALSLSACAGKAQNTKNQVTTNTTEETQTSQKEDIEETKEDSNAKEVVKEPVENKNVTVNIEQFSTHLQRLPLSVTSTKYVVQDDEYKSLYPDMLQVIIQNNTQKDIKDARVAFVAWDENNLPVKILGSMDFSNGAYIKQVNFGDINLVPGKTFGDSSGFAIDEKCKIKTFEAIVVSYESFDGDKWENPFYTPWVELYEGKKYSEDSTVEVSAELIDSLDDMIEEANATSENSNSSTSSMSEEELDTEIAAQEVRVTSTDYIVQDEQYKSLYPDMLQAIIQNDSNLDIKDALVAFVAWDENGLPVKIKGAIDFNDGEYVKKANYGDINLVSGKSFGDSSGYSVDENCGIKTFKAIVVSFESFDGTKWENPLFDAWVELYEGTVMK